MGRDHTVHTDHLSDVCFSLIAIPGPIILGPTYKPWRERAAYDSACCARVIYAYVWTINNAVNEHTASFDSLRQVCCVCVTLALGLVATTDYQVCSIQYETIVNNIPVKTSTAADLLQAYRAAGGTSCSPPVCLCYTRARMHGRSFRYARVIIALLPSCLLS